MAKSMARLCQQFLRFLAQTQNVQGVLRIHVPRAGQHWSSQPVDDVLSEQHGCSSCQAANSSKKK